MPSSIASIVFRAWLIVIVSICHQARAAAPTFEPTIMPSTSMPSPLPTNDEALLISMAKNNPILVSLGWKTTVTKYDTSKTPPWCLYEGVFCADDKDPDFRQVISLVLNRIPLNGVLPFEVSFFRKLRNFSAFFAGSRRLISSSFHPL
jgi:hypothetical protein